MDLVANAGRTCGDPLALETCGLRKRFGRHQVLSGVDLRVPEGVISVLLGPSGTGKSVLLKHILGLLDPDAGDILVRGRALSGMRRSEVAALRREIGVMFQDGALFSSMTVYDNVAFPLRQHTDLREREVRGLVEAQLRAVGLLTAASRLPGELSGGMRKRAGLARALVLDPGIVLCDEPDSGLDPVRTALLGDLLMERHAELGGTMLIVTHNIALAQHVSDHVSVIWQGEILASGAAEGVFASDLPFVRQFLAGATQGPLSMD
jgi:phospholipid/cholesterol/gamma-HCH transport system ATP-binding protein